MDKASGFVTMFIIVNFDFIHVKRIRNLFFKDLIVESLRILILIHVLVRPPNQPKYFQQNGVVARLQMIMILKVRKLIVLKLLIKLFIPALISTPTIVIL